MTAPNPPSRALRAAIAVLWGFPAACLIDTGYAALLRGWRPVGTIETVLLAAPALWMASAGALGHSAVRERLGGLWRELLLLGISGALGLLVLEVAAGRLEAAVRPHAPFHTRGINIHNTFTPHPDWLPGIEGDSRFTTGPDGIRAPAPPAEDQRRVLCIGGSTTECVYLDDSETWPALLPKYAGVPNLWVGNVGISGLDTRDHLKFAESSPLLEGIDALVIQPGVNDMWRFLAKEVEAMDYGRFETPEPAQEDAVEGKTQPYRPWWTRSRLIQLYHTIRQPPPPPEQREGVGGEEYQIRREKRAAAALTDTLPDLEAGLEAYRTRVTAIIRACRARGVKVLFTTQAVLWRGGLPPDQAARCWFGWLPDGSYLSIAALRTAIDQYNGALLAVCAREGVPCVDLSPLNGDPALFYDDCHFTEAGADRVAALAGPVLGAALVP